MNLNDKVAIVTGGCSGLGLATARALVKEGCSVGIFDTAASAAALVIAEPGRGRAGFFEVDVRDADSVEAAISQLLRDFGAVHLCVNCAGIGSAQRTLDREGRPQPLEAFSKVVDVNLNGTFNVARLAAAAMADNAPSDEAGERGLIVNTASIAGFEGQSGQAAYAASKGGIIALTLPMARDLAPLGIRVNAIAPGLMGTPLLAGLPERVQAALVSQIQFPGRLGRPEEFAALVVHLAQNTYINGETIRLDGGLRMQAG